MYLTKTKNSVINLNGLYDNGRKAGKKSVFTCYAIEVFIDERGENFDRVENGQRSFWPKFRSLEDFFVVCLVF